LERRFPEPTLFPKGGAGLAQASALWTDRGFFQAAVAVIFGNLGERVPQAFIKDREDLSGRPFAPSAMRAAIPHMTRQLRANAALIAEQLADGRRFLSGDRPGLSDANAYYNLWFVQSTFPEGMAVLAGLPQVFEWAERVRQIGHGARIETTGAEALDIARKARPEPFAGDVGALIGKEVIVAANDYGRDPVSGKLVGEDEFRLSLLRSNPDLGDIVVHFPKIGFAVTPVEGDTRGNSA
jgi:glutathione S-transferase